MPCCHDNGLCLRSKTWKIRVIMLVTLLVKFRNKDCKTTERGLLLQVLPVRIVTFVETLRSYLKWLKPTARQKEEILCDCLTAKIFEQRAGSCWSSDRSRTQRGKSLDLSTSSNRMKASFIQIWFRSLLSFKTSLLCVFWMHLWSHAWFSEFAG